MPPLHQQACVVDTVEMLEQAEMVVHAPTITVMLMAVAGTAETAETVTEDRAKMVRTHRQYRMY